MAAGTVSRRVTMVIRILMGLLFLVFGLNGFLNFIPQPKDLPPEVISVSKALMEAGYMKVVSATEVLVGVLLITGFFVPLALALIAPIVVGIITFHLSLAPNTIAPAIVVLVLELYLAFAYRHAFYPMLTFKTTPGPK
jgi:uncharacterized membrane protein YphA (DoxX/SURF4 family)